MRTSVIKTAVLGLTVASTSLFAEATYSPHKEFPKLTSWNSAQRSLALLVVKLARNTLA